MQTKIFFPLFLMTICTGLLPTTFQSNLEEICDNAQDDDGDGLIDLNDPDCLCQAPEPSSLIPNPSFEETDCCPSGNGQLFCAKTWIQASEATTDYYNRCGYFTREQFPLPQPIPDGDAYIGFRNGRFGDNPNPNWKEYTGACLLSPLEAGTSYTFEFYIGFVDFDVSPPMSVVLYGTTDCEYLPFGTGDGNFGCPTNDVNWRRLGSVFVSGTNRWNKYAISTTPSEDIQAIAIGPDCRELDRSVNPYYFLDNLVLADSKLFGPAIEDSGHPCSEDFTLKASEKPGFTYQWYRDGIAVVGATGLVLKPAQREGNYQLLARTDNTCVSSDIFNYTLPRFSNSAELTICPGDTYRFGDQLLTKSGSYTNTFPNADGCDSTVVLDLTVLPETIDTFETHFFKGETFRIGRYSFNQAVEADLILTSSLGCDSLVHLVLREYQLYIPNAFSPNGDGVNDLFRIYGSEDLISIQSLKIYDRWGNQVYAQTDAEDFQWDGGYSRQVLENGVYLYVLELILNGGQRKVLSGDIAIIR